MHVRKGDNVIVISGKDKGKTGKVLEALPKKERVVVEGVNIIKNTKTNSVQSRRWYLRNRRYYPRIKRSIT